MANMGGTWLAIVYGFAGLRVKESGLSLAPSLPDHWGSLEFQLQYQNRTLNILIERRSVIYTLTKGDSLSISHMGETIDLKVDKGIKIEL